MCLACCDFDVQIADFGFRQRGIVVSLESEGNGFDDLPFGIVPRIGAADRQDIRIRTKGIGGSAGGTRQCTDDLGR